MKRGGTLLMLACLLVLAAQSAYSIEPKKTEAIVYRIQAFAAQEYATVYSPPEADTLYLIADSDNALDPRYTLVYYWPLTREYFESWEKLDVALDGVLEVLSGSHVVMSAERTEVVFAFAHATAEGASTLHEGQEARTFRDSFDAHRREYERSMELYGQQMLEYHKALREYLRASSRSSIAAPLPQEPVEPAPPDEFVSDPQSAFVVRLPQGTYSMRMVDREGNVIEGSERRLVSFQALSTRGTGFEIIPEERWTARVRTDAPEASLFCAPGKELYLIPYVTESYRQDYLARLRNPQSQELSRKAIQVYTSPREAGWLVLRPPGRLPTRVALMPYFVKQNSGSELGYSIVEWTKAAAGKDSPTFTAFRLDFNPEDAGSAWQIGLEDPVTARIVAGSERSLRVVNARGRRLPLLFSLVPVLIGACVVIWRRKKS